MLVAGLVGSGQLWPAVAFVTRHPEALLLMMLLSVAATLGDLPYLLYALGLAGQFQAATCTCFITYNEQHFTTVCSPEALSSILLLIAVL